MEKMTTSFVVAIVASVAAIVLFELTQHFLFTDVLRNVTVGSYTARNLHLEVKEITEEHAVIYVKEDEVTCNLKEAESCYSGCSQITVLDVKKEGVDVQVREDIICKMKVAIDRLRIVSLVGKFFTIVQIIF